MAKVHHVKKARKAIPHAGIEVGESYYWWKFRTNGRGGSKCVSKRKPRQSQLTQSEFLSAVYAAEESVSDAVNAFDVEPDFEALASELESAAEAVREAGEEAQGRYDNMPESLQGGETGQLLEGRAQRAEEIADELERAAEEIRSAVEETSEPKEGETEAEAAAREEALDGAKENATSLANDVDWSVE